MTDQPTPEQIDAFLHEVFTAAVRNGIQPTSVEVMGSYPHHLNPRAFWKKTVSCSLGCSSTEFEMGYVGFLSAQERMEIMGGQG